MVAFEASEGPGLYALRPGAPPAAPDVAEPDTAGYDLVLTRPGGKQFRSSLDASVQRVVEERGPVKTTLRLEGVCRAEDGEGLFRYILRFSRWRNRPETHLAVTWINATGAPSEKILDIRLHFPVGLLPERMVFGAGRGVYDGPFFADWPVTILQDDDQRFLARTRNPDGRLQHLSSGGADGDHCPGWISLRGQGRSFSFWARRFWQEYPSEIAVSAGELSLGLWPAAAASHLRSLPVLPPNPDGEKPYVKTKYWPVMPHPYLAFFDPGSGCLDARQGMAKTQEIIVSRDEGFETKYWASTLAPVRAHIEPHYVVSAGVAAPLAAGGNYARLFEECFGWFERHTAQARCYGKFDHGDFRYMTPAADYMTHPGTKWGKMGEMPREGYWHNNEGDPLLGILQYYLRTADPRAWDRACLVARHLLDVDIRHHPYFGMYTHSYGHCYVETAPAGAPDHSWLAGLLLWCAMSGDAVARKWMEGCGEYLLQYRPDFTQVDTRTVSVYLLMMCRYYDYTADERYRRAAAAPARALMEVQNPDGSWPAYMRAAGRPRDAGFVDHAVAALADYFAMEGSPEAQKALDAAIDWQFRSGDLAVPLVAYGLAILSRKLGRRRYSALAGRILAHLDQTQNRSEDPWGRGDIGWAQFGVHPGAGHPPAGRPKQFLNQTRPLMPGFTLAYAQPAAAVVEPED